VRATVSTDDLLELVHRELLPTLAPLGFKLVQSDVTDSFDNASVMVEGPDLRIRIVRERSQLFADFGPLAEPNTWYDSAVVIDYLGLSGEAGFHGRNVAETLHGVAAFVSACHRELERKFDLSNIAATKRGLERLKEVRAAKLFGS
jgi:hypothetical protein